MTKRNYSRRCRCFEIICSAGKVNGLVTHKLVDRKKRKKKKVIFEPIGLIDFKSSHITLHGYESHSVRSLSWAPLGSPTSVTWFFLKERGRRSVMGGRGRRVKFFEFDYTGVSGECGGGV